MKLSDKQILFEQLALLFASFVWTTVILAAIAAFWAYQDVQARWEFVLNAPPEALAQAVASPTVTLTPTPTVWSPPPTLTPSPTKPPTPTATWVVPPPNFLPETLNPDEPTPIPVTVEPGDQVPQVDAPPATPTPIPPAPVVDSTPEPQPPAQNPTPAPPPTATPLPQPAPPPAPAPNPPSGDGAVPTHLVIPSVGIDANIISVGWQMVEQNGQQFSIWQVADYAVGWHEASARLGQPGNTVMAGHHNVNGEVFRDLVNVEVGDKVEIYAGEQKFEYQVELKTIVKEKGEPIEARQRNAQWIASTTDERITLVTCWPYTNNTHRVIVVAKRL
jgi:LPXTG-site transpeptidase (sortase) family protein